MGVLNRLQKTQPENLRVVSDNRLESDRGVLIFGREKYGSDREFPFIDVTTNEGFSEYKFIQRETLVWDCTINKTGEPPKETEIQMNDMNDGLKSLKNLGIECGPLMQRAICGIAIQHSRALLVKDLNEAEAELGPMPDPPKTNNIFGDDVYGEAIAKRIAKTEDRAFIKTAFRRANLSISKDGTVVDLKTTQRQNQGGRA